MEENKFEKQVRQKMDELKIHPSDSVWKKIEARIEKRKRSNRGLFLFLLLFFVFLTGGYFLWNTGQHSIKESNHPEKNYSKKSTHEIPVKNNDNPGATNNLTPGLITKKMNTAGAVRNMTVKNNINRNSSQHYKALIANNIIKINSEKVSMALAEEKKRIDISGKINTKTGAGQPREIQSMNEKINEEPEDSTYKKISMDSLTIPPIPDNIKEKDTSKHPPVIKGVVKHVNKTKWKPGILFSAGISGVGNDFLGLVNSPAYDYSRSAGPGTISGASPSRTKSGFGFMTGVFAERNISAKIKLVTGINFKSFSNSNKVGIRNDTTGLYNSLNTVNRYKNHYKFIELPVALKVRIGRGTGPLFWQGGFVISELISSDALQFNQSSGYYYSDNSIFNKTQIGFNTSISATLFSKQKNSVLIGPYFYYGASRLAHEGLYNKKHFVFTGLRTEIIFGK